MENVRFARSAAATRATFLAAGFAVACWAPLVPYAQVRLRVGEGVLGLLLLCVGIGALAAMPLSGAACSRFGARWIILVAGGFLACCLPFLGAASSPLTLGAALLVFGASLGAIDVAMNVHAVQVETQAPRPMMSGFHALFSVGAFIGAAAMTFLLALALPPMLCAGLCAVLTVVLIVFAGPRLLPGEAANAAFTFALPRGVVVPLAVLAMVAFLIEGAVLDWGALLSTQLGMARVSEGGLAYMLFSAAMTVARFGGDRVIARVGDKAALRWSGWLALAGFVVLLLCPWPLLGWAGFLLLGLGTANVVPVLFRRAGKQKVMPPALAVSAITTTGYAGVLLGPAAIGFLASHIGLQPAFWVLAALFATIPLFAGAIAQDENTLA